MLPLSRKLPDGSLSLKHLNIPSIRFILLMLPCLLAACAGGSDPNLGAQMTEIIEPERTAAVTSSALTPTVATAEAAPSSSPRSLHLWWPEPLAPVDDEDAVELLSAQISGFQNANPDVLVDFRLKSVASLSGQEVGSLMSTLRSAAAVAPGALPDLTLLRRSQLLEAVQAGLLQPFRIPAAISNDLHPAVIELGSPDGSAYGLAYVVEVKHMAMNANVEPPSRWRFEDVLAAEYGFVFPAGRVNTLSDVFLVQYLNAGRAQSPPQELVLDGELAIDSTVLRSVYEFYEAAVAGGIIDPVVLEYITADDYATALIEGEVTAGVVTSTLYLSLLEQGAALDYGLIPTVSGEAATVVDGWMWVLTTPDAQKQETAMRFLNWMMDVDRQAAYSSAVNMLPSQRTALRGLSLSAYATFVDGLLTGATLPLSDTGGGTPARVVQSALAMVISGQRTAEQAAREVIAQLSG